MFAEVISVSRNRAVDAPNLIRLAPFTPQEAAQIIPLGRHDPAYRELTRPQQQRYGSRPEHLTEVFAENPKVAGWGVHVGQAFAGFMAVHAVRSSPRMEIVLGTRFRRQGIGTMALLGACAASFTPDYLHHLNSDVWETTPPRLVIEAVRGTPLAKRVAPRLGFTYAGSDRPWEEARQVLNQYELHGHLVTRRPPGSRPVQELNVGVQQLYMQLTQFYTVTGEGAVPIPNPPEHLLQRTPQPPTGQP